MTGLGTLGARLGIANAEAVGDVGAASAVPSAPWSGTACFVLMPALGGLGGGRPVGAAASCTSRDALAEDAEDAGAAVCESTVPSLPPAGNFGMMCLEDSLLAASGGGCEGGGGFATIWFFDAPGGGHSGGGGFDMPDAPICGTLFSDSPVEESAVFDLQEAESLKSDRVESLEDLRVSATHDDDTCAP